ncbi:MAG TPA: hypothetical protein VL201_03980 [Patescibacteria group bacterium]|jgi:hypothetical protein|nr:hypothetical protein [Patescibacteria group bacterium]
MHKPKSIFLFLFVLSNVSQDIFSMNVTRIKKNSLDSFSHSTASLIASLENLSKKIEQYQQLMRTEQQYTNLPADDCNLPIQVDYDCNLPMELTEANFNLPTNTYIQYIPHTKEKITFNTTLLLKLFVYIPHKIFDDYHCVPAPLINLLIKHGQYRHMQYKCKDCIRYSCYGLYCTVVHNILDHSTVNQFHRKLIYTTKEACVKKSVKKSKNYIFHIGFHNVSSKYYEDYFFKKIGKNISKKIEQKILNYHSKKTTLRPSLYINITRPQNTVSFDELNNIYDTPIVKTVGKNKDILIFPCPNKTFFITTNKCLTLSLNNC